MSSLKRFVFCSSSRRGGKFIGWLLIVLSAVLGLLLTVIMSGIYKSPMSQQLIDKAYYEYMIIVIVYLVFNIYFSSLLVNGIKNDNPHHILGWLIYNGAFIVTLSFNISVNFLFIEWILQLTVIIVLTVWVYFWLSIFALYQKVAKDFFKPMPSVIYQVPEYQNPQIEKKVGSSVIYV